MVLATVTVWMTGFGAGLSSLGLLSLLSVVEPEDEFEAVAVWPDELPPLEELLLDELLLPDELPLDELLPDELVDVLAVVDELFSALFFRAEFPGALWSPLPKPLFWLLDALLAVPLLPAVELLLPVELLADVAVCVGAAGWEATGTMLCVELCTAPCATLGATVCALAAFAAEAAASAVALAAASAAACAAACAAA